MISGWTTHRSALDESVNFVRPGEGGVGVEECRYVHRAGHPDFTAYLSCQTGCAQGCRMCWLTASKQGALVDVSAGNLSDQLHRVLRYWCDEVGEDRATCNVAFMARGEPLVSSFGIFGGRWMHHWSEVIRETYGLFPRFKISTIIPATTRPDAFEKLCEWGVQPDVYYSLYSVAPAFRAKWLPQAMDPGPALSLLATYQRQTHKIPRLHWALIQGENDQLGDVVKLCDAVERAGLRVDVNLVRYNPPGDEAAYGRESSEERVLAVEYLLQRRLGASVVVVERVGPDVAASCGMFTRKDRTLPVLSRPSRGA